MVAGRGSQTSARSGGGEAASGGKCDGAVCVCVILSTLAAGWGPSGVFRRVTPSVVALFSLE